MLGWVDQTSLLMVQDLQILCGLQQKGKSLVVSSVCLVRDAVPGVTTALDASHAGSAAMTQIWHVLAKLACWQGMLALLYAPHSCLLSPSASDLTSGIRSSGHETAGHINLLNIRSAPLPTMHLLRLVLMLNLKLILMKEINAELSKALAQIRCVVTLHQILVIQ